VPHHRFELARVVFDVARRGFVVLALGELEKFGGIADALGGPVDLPDVGGESRPLPSQLLRPLLVRPDRGVLQLAPYLLEAFFLRVVLKETPVRSRFAPRDL
jgi:hypothetical protein